MCNGHAQLIGTFHVFIDLLHNKGILTKEKSEKYIMEELVYIREILKNRAEEISRRESPVVKFFQLLLSQSEGIDTGFKKTPKDIRVLHSVALHNLNKTYGLRWNNESVKKALENAKGVFAGTKPAKYHGNKTQRLDVYDRTEVEKLLGIAEM